jgi:hypothetical protein
MSRFDVCSAVQQSDIARQIVPIFQPARVGLKKMCFAVGQEVGTFPGKFVIRSAKAPVCNLNPWCSGQEYEFN